MKLKNFNVNKECIVCNKSLVDERNFSNSYLLNKATCSEYCSSVKRRMIATQTSQYRTCSNCDKLIITKLKLSVKRKTHLNGRSHIFCSHKCHSQFMSYDYSYHQRSKHRTPKNYGSDWPHRRNECRQRENFKCADCGISESVYGKQLSVHHVKPFISFDSTYEANQLSNLVAICEPCHRIRHSGANHPLSYTDFGKNALLSDTQSKTVLKRKAISLFLQNHTYDDVLDHIDNGLTIGQLITLNRGVKSKTLLKSMNISEFPISKFAEFHYKYSRRKIDIDYIPLILNDLINTTLTCEDISHKYEGVDPWDVAGINRGELYKEFHNYTVPIRTLRLIKDKGKV